MSLLLEEYEAHLNRESDIREHLPTLRKFASQSNTVVELGVRTGVSTRALLAGKPRRMLSYDLNPFTDYERLRRIAAAEGVDFEFIQGDSRLVQIPRCNLLFIDTLHNYKQLLAELQAHAHKVLDRIILHDTATYGVIGDDGGQGLLAAWEAYERTSTVLWDLEYQSKSCNGLSVFHRLTL